MNEEAAWPSGIRRYYSWPSSKPEFGSGSGLGQADLICGLDDVLTTSFTSYATLLAQRSMSLWWRLLLVRRGAPRIRTQYGNRMCQLESRRVLRRECGLEVYQACDLRSSAGPRLCRTFDCRTETETETGPRLLKWYPLSMLCMLLPVPISLKISV